MANAGDCSIELLPDVFRKTIVAKRNLSLDKGHFITVNRRLRNCIAHYGLGQYMIDDEIIEHDPMKGMTEKFLNMDYFDAKNKLYGLMRRLVEEIEDAIY